MSTSTKVGTGNAVIHTAFFAVTKKTQHVWEGMGIILLAWGRDRIFPQFFRRIGMGQDFLEGSGRERFENPVPCYPLVYVCVGQ